MLRRLLILAVAALALAPAALADGQMPFAAQGSPGAVSPDGSLRYLALNAGADTVLAEVQTKDGTLHNETTLVGSYGIPSVVYGDVDEGLSHDGRTLVVGNTGLDASSRFLVFDTRTLRMTDWIVLLFAKAGSICLPTAAR